ncbi:MAG: ferritin-like domain-containing protein [Myxococcales bacterium]|nr:ferritin-like domain-containing protein [Myxococcales bacterium]
MNSLINPNHRARVDGFRRSLLRALGLPTALVTMTCMAPACGDSSGPTSASESGESTESGETSAGPETTGGSQATEPGTTSAGSETAGATSTTTGGETTEPGTGGETTAPATSGETTEPGTTGGETTSPGTTSGETTTGGETTDAETSGTTGDPVCEVPPLPGYTIEDACFPIPDGLESCDQCDAACTEYNVNAAITMDPDFCWADGLMILCGPEDGVPQQQGMCCYTAGYTGILCEGRPCLVDGAPRVAALERRSDWSDRTIRPHVDALDPATREALAAAWRHDGLMEHASVAAFSRFIMQLMAVAAPAWLVDESTQAIDDEINHARLCFGLGDRYAGDAMGPGELNIDDLLEEPCTLAEVAAATVREGCVAETIAALLVRDALARARDPEVVRALTTIAEDEARHATLAWRFVQWALAEGDEATREATRAAVREAFDGAVSVVPEARAWPAGVDAAAMGAHGQLDAARQRVVIQEALVEVIQPCAAALLDAGARDHRALEILPFAPGVVH